MKQILSNLLLIVCIVSTSSMAFGQKFHGNYNVLLKSGTVTFTNNVENFISQPNLTAFEAKESHFYRFIQFDEVPTEAQLQQVANRGIKLLEYIPHKTYVAAIPTNMNFQLLKTLNVRAVREIEADIKLNEYLRNQVYPNWSVEGNELLLNVKLYEGKNRKQLLSAMFGLGAKVINIYYRSNLVQIKIRKNDDAVRAIANLPFVSYVETFDPPGEREDVDGRGLQKTNMLNEASANGLKYDGTGIFIQTRDDGPVGPHIDFEGRIEQVGASSTGSHGDGVAGVWAGAGNLNPYNEGGATGSFMYITDYNANHQDTTYGLHLYRGMLVANSSYSNGCNAGYTTTTQTVDEHIWDSKTLMYVFSAGNSNNTDCGYGAGNQWGNITGGHKVGKNVIATANLNSTGTLENSSSRGPASDGRIKPDMAAYGQGQISTDENNTYQSFGGTSAAAPSGAGVYTMLLHAYKDMHNGTEPKSGLIKATVMNTARDLGNAGPDFRFGWGLYNGGRAYNLLKENRYITGSVAQGATNNHTFTIPANVEEARIMVYWMEPEGSPASALALVNDLDMTIGNGVNVTLPLVLDETATTTALNSTAVPGVDNLNNVEQVRLANPTAGTYTVNVSGSTAPFGAVEYYVLYEYITDEIKVTYPNGGEGLDPSRTARIHWDAHGTTTTNSFALHYSTNNGASWNLITNAVSGAARLYNWNVPGSVTDNAIIRVTRGAVSDQSDTTFSIIGVPSGLSIDTVCSNGITVSWNAVTGATSYDVMVLGDKYMDSTTTTTGTSATFAGAPFDEYWISVRARVNDGVGTRANAIFHGGGLLNCVLNDEMSMLLISPSGSAAGCVADSAVVVQVFNNGINTQTNIPVSYQLGNNTVVTETMPGPLTVGQNANYTFTTLLPITTGVQYDLKAWVDLAADPLPQNDTVSASLEFFSAFSAPFADDFEAYAACGTASNCGAEICPLANGWSNNENGTVDNIDWRVDAGGTISTGTGPSVDHSPGTSTGNYLYLEASNGCNGQVAELISPCIDLTAANVPVFSIWYHMEGTAVGELHIDILSNGAWINDIVAPIIGNQGSNWLEATTSLSAYVGQVVNIRVRGITGNNWSSDIAIDDFNVFDITQAPVAAFTSNKVNACLGTPVTFTDESTIFPSTWQWTFTPNTVTFANGTSATSQNPVVQFNALGFYDVRLVATNAIGGDSLTKTSYIDVTSGVAIPITENFDATFPATNWSIENPDQLNSWTQSASVTGATGTATLAASMDNFNYNAQGQEDFLYMPVMNLTTQASAALKFDLAHARYSIGFTDGLRVELSTDCGTSYTILYDKSGADLSTVPDQTQLWSPTAAADWRTEELDLTPYVGNTVLVRFVGVNGYGNSLFIDNVNIYDPTNVMPIATYDVSNPACYNGTTFTSTTIGATSWSWDFGANATPQTANTAGPHTVTFSNASAQNVSLTVMNNAGNDVLSQTIAVDSTVDASFTFTTNNEIINFGGVNTGGTSYFWDFGDGTSSTAMFPGNHVYNTSGLFTVSLTVTNTCGSSTSSANIDVIVSDVNNLTKDWNVNVFPNPTSGQFTVALDGIFGDVELSITDVAGKQIRAWNYSNIATGWKTAIDASELAKGIYILKVKSGDDVKNLKLAIE
jgi:PKD repeat protein